MKIKWFLLIGILLFCIPVVFYALSFKEFVISDNPDDWAAFGNYLGGVLNPFFALINIIIFIYLTQLVSKLEDQRSQQALENQKKITLNEFRQREFKELAQILNGVIEELSHFEIALSKANIALYKIKTSHENIVYLFPILKEAENVKLIDDIASKLNEIIGDLSKMKANKNNKNLRDKILTELGGKFGLEPKMSDYLKLKTKLIQILQSYILDDLGT